MNRLHVESAAIIAGVAFFAAGLSALSAFRRGARLTGEVLRQEAALLLPLAMLTISMLWEPNCGYWTGLLFFGLFPVISVVLAVSAAYLLAALPLKRPRLWFIVGGMLVVVLAPLYDLGLHPQFYTYNHVFGGVLGPIYDEELALRPGLFWFRGLTLLWALLFLLTGRWTLLRRKGDENSTPHPLSTINHPPPTPHHLLPTILTTLLLTLAYLNSARLGFNTPAWYIQQQLGARLVTPHFVIIYDTSVVEEAALRRLAQDHEFQYHRYARRLGAAPDEPIYSYLYPSPESKAALTGARLTNVSPVWLPDPQVHVLLSAYEESFAHELAHVFSRTFGLPVINASLAVGLVEGFAVAMEPPDGRPTPDEQVIAALSTFSRFKQANLADEVAARLSPMGFWTHRGAVSYATMGSFVGYLLNAYPSEHFKAAYATADFEDAYGKPLEVLAGEWLDALMQRESLSIAAAPLVSERFTRPSLLEERCPHYVPPYVRVYRRGNDALAQGDGAAAHRLFVAALELEPGAEEVLAAWSALALSQGKVAAVVERLEGTHNPLLLVRLADALVLLGRAEAARARYEEAQSRLPIIAHSARMQIALRAALAGEPAMIRTLISGGAEEERAERLARHQPAPPAARILQAFLLSDAGHSQKALDVYSAAVADFTESLEPPFRLTAERTLLAWHATFAYRDGQLVEAAGHARSAAACFRSAGDLNTAATLQHFAEKIEWLS